MVQKSGYSNHLDVKITKHVRYLKWRNPHLYKLYGYGLCKGKPTPKIALLGSGFLHFGSLKLLVKKKTANNGINQQPQLVSRISSTVWLKLEKLEIQQILI